MEYILEKAINKNSLTKEEIIYLLQHEDNLIFETANKICEKYKGKNIHLRALLEFSNICKQNCLYCGIRKDNKNIERYRLPKEEIIQSSIKAKNEGFKTIVLQSGEDSFFDADKICNIIKEIKKLDLAITLSIGERTKEEYKAFKNAGADRFLIRIETTDKALYHSLHPNMDYDNRINCIYTLKELGYETGTGCLVGLANQTLESLADDILFFKSINADMVGIGPFIPHPNTPLCNEKKDNFLLSLKVMAITRLLLPDINIPATTAMETLMPKGKLIALKSGANVIMTNITDDSYIKKYELYPNKSKSGIYSSKNMEYLKEELLSINKTISNSKGFRYD